MKINYILSNTTKGATSKALSQVVSEAEKKLLENFVVIVPETKSIIIEKEILALSSNAAVANVFVYSFVRLLGKFNNVPKEKIISKQTAVMLIRKIIYDNLDKLDCYKKTAKNINFAEKIYETLQQFKSSDVSVEDLKTALEGCDNSLKAKLLDIILIYDEYEKMLGENLFDDCDKLNMLKKFAGESEFIKSSHIYIVGFDNVTSEMVSVLTELAKNAKDITFSSVFFDAKREDNYIQTNELFKKFRRVAENLKYKYIPVPYKKINKGDFYRLENNLFLPKLEKVKYDGHVKIYEANSKEEEIRFVASKIIELIKLGKRFKDIGVLALNLVEDGEKIKQIFDEYKINYFVNEDIDVSNHYLIGFIKNCFELCLSNLSSEIVLKFLKSPFVESKKVAAFENFVVEYGFNYGDFLKPLPDGFKEKCNDFDAFAKILTEFQAFYIKFAEKLKNAESVFDFCEAINFVVEWFDIKTKLAEISAFEKNCGWREKSSVSDIILDKLTEFLNMFKNFFGNTKVNADEFLQIFLSGFSTVRINLSPVSVDCVVVQNNTDGFFDLKDLFIVSADEDKFPVMIQDMGIILDSELEAANLLINKEIEPTTKDINAREKFAAFESLLEPSENLFVSYSKQGEDGSQKKPSIIVQKIKDLFGKENVLVKDFVCQKNISKQGTIKDFSKHVGEFFDGKTDLEDLNEEYNLLKKDFGENFKSYLENMTKSEQSFKLVAAKDLFFAGAKTSASQLERYFACPYSFFATYGLKLKENKNSKLSQLDVGNLMHKLAELFVKNIDKFLNIEESKRKSEIENFISGVFEDFNLNKTNNRASLKVAFEEAKRLCDYLILEQQNSSFKAKVNEFSFSKENAVKILLDDKTEILFEGKIDRIDEFGEFIRIIDYKTGSIDASLFSVYHGKKMQLVSYLMAISQIKNKKIAALLYLPIHSEYVKNEEKLEEKYKMDGFLLNNAEVLKYMDASLSFDNPKSKFIPLTIASGKEAKKLSGFKISRAGDKILSMEDFETLKSYNEKLLKQAIEEIRNGNIMPSPIKKGGAEQTMPCTYCNLRGFCGVENTKFKNGRSCVSLVKMKDFYEKETNETKEGE